MSRKFLEAAVFGVVAFGHFGGGGGGSWVAMGREKLYDWQKILMDLVRVDKK